MGIQRTLGLDIAMVFDDCPPHTSTPREFRAAVDRTIQWAANVANNRVPRAKWYSASSRAEWTRTCGRMRQSPRPNEF